jgi:hypothetical protein
MLTLTQLIASFSLNSITSPDQQQRIIVAPDQQQRILKRLRRMLSPKTVPKKRSRSCPRVVRQPVGSWPRKLSQREASGPINVKIVT